MNRHGSWRGVCFAVLGLLFAPIRVGAQVPCDPPPRLAFGTRYRWVTPLAVASRGADIVVLGENGFDLHGRAPAIPLPPVDSNIAGFVLREGKEALAVPRPFPERGFEGPYVIEGGRDWTRVLFDIPVPRREFGRMPASLEIWTGVIRGTAWQELRHLLTVDGHSRLTPQHANPPFRWDGATWLAFGLSDPTRWTNGITSLGFADGAWRIERDTSAVVYAGYLEHFVDNERLLRVVIGSVRTGANSKDYLPSGIVVQEHEYRRWWPPRLVVRGDSSIYAEPHIIRAVDGLYLAWRTLGNGPEGIRWRGLSPGTDTAMHETASEGRLGHSMNLGSRVLTFAIPSDSAVIATIERGALRVHVTLPTVVMMPPLLLLHEGRALALTNAWLRREPPGEGELRVHDITCQVRAAGVVP